MLKLEITLKREDGTVVAKLERDTAMQPADFRTPYDTPIQDGSYYLFGFVYQPIVQLKLQPTR